MNSVESEEESKQEEEAALEGNIKEYTLKARDLLNDQEQTSHSSKEQFTEKSK